MSAHTNPQIPEFTEEVDSEVKSFLETPSEADFKETNVAELVTVIKRFKNNKAPGLDNITNIVLKKLPLLGLGFLVGIFNGSCMKLNYFSQQWKSAKLLVFPKAGKDLTVPASYRPISLLNTMSKAFEAILLRRVNHEVHARNLLRPEQYGFRSEHSTNHQILRMTEDITDNFNRNRHIGAFLLDVAKAFDSVWTNGLIHKLINLGFPPGLVKILASYLYDRKFCVDVYGILSEEHPATAGVPQGSLLGPVLFTLYINDLPTIPGVHIGIYADDTALWTTSWSKTKIVDLLNRALDEISKWCAKWRIKINADKSEAILFSHKRNPTKDLDPPQFDNEPIAWKTFVKYLGVYLDQKLTFSKHTTHARNKAVGAMTRLAPLIKKQVGIRNGLTIYKMIIRPITTYAAPIWGGTYASNIKKLDIIQNKCLKLITNVPRYTPMKKVHEEVNLPFMSDVIRQLTTNFYESASNSRFEHIRKLGTYRYDPINKYRRPKDFLHDNVKGPYNNKKSRRANRER